MIAEQLYRTQSWNDGAVQGQSSSSGVIAYICLVFLCFKSLNQSIRDTNDQKLHLSPLFVPTPPKTLRMALADRSFGSVLQTECTLQSRNSCMYHSRFMWSFLLPCCCATFGLVRKINDKNDQESTICNVCDGEIHRRVWGWVDSLLPDCRLINYGAENNSWIKPNWWMAMSGERGSWGYALLRWYSNYISWPWRRFGDVDTQQLIYIHFLTLYLSSEGLLSTNTRFQ